MSETVQANMKRYNYIRKHGPVMTEEGLATVYELGKYSSDCFYGEVANLSIVQTPTGRLFRIERDETGTVLETTQFRDSMKLIHSVVQRPGQEAHKQFIITNDFDKATAYKRQGFQRNDLYKVSERFERFVKARIRVCFNPSSPLSTLDYKFNLPKIHMIYKGWCIENNETALPMSSTEACLEERYGKGVGIRKVYSRFRVFDSDEEVEEFDSLLEKEN